MSPCLILTNIKTLAYALVFFSIILIKNIFADGELDKNSVTEKISTTVSRKKLLTKKDHCW